jgi:uncharacterized protein (TIGR02145 family)
MRLSLIILFSATIYYNISAQGVTKNGQNTTTGTDFVNKRGKILAVPALSRYGQELIFVTLTTTTVSSITATTAMSGGEIGNDGGSAITLRGVCWSTLNNPTIGSNKTIDGNGTGPFTSSVTGLIPGTIYYIRSYAINSNGTAYGEELQFQTTARTNPEDCLISWYPFNENANEESGLGVDGMINGATLTSDRFGIANSALYFNGIDNSVTIPAYLPITNQFTISFWAYSEKESGYCNILSDGNINYGGNDFLINFRDDGIGIRADKGGNPLDLEYDSPAELKNLNLRNRWVHVVWVMNPAGSIIYLNSVKIAEINIPGTNEGFHDDHVTIGARHVWTNMDNFFQGKLDDFRFYTCELSNEEIYNLYKDEGSWQPVVETNVITNITGNTATSGGNIINDGGSAVTSRGVCWSTSVNPTIYDNMTTDGSGPGAFTSSVSGLSPGTVYYLRSYATNSSGTAYGNEKTFSTSADTANCGMVTDIDGNIYNTVIIGPKCWIQENLKTTKFNDGNDITLVTDNAVWINLMTPGYCWYSNDALNNKNTYGALYNWFSISTGKLCPSGWHVPTDAEYYTYLSFLSGQLREAGTSHWQSPNDGATNSSGFTALPGGMRFYGDASFRFAGSMAFLWTASGYDASSAWDRNIQYNSDYQTASYENQRNGFSVRCIQGEVVGLPSLTTISASSITNLSAVSGGNVMSEGGSPVTTRGVCWSTSINPSLADYKTSDGVGSGLFPSEINCLKPGITYYVRAYASNAEGTAYGNEISLTANESYANCGTITDTDGNIYNTVVIGTQCWMHESLKTTKYNDGTSIPLVINNTEWANLTSPGYCWHSNDEAAYKNLYGALYNWYTVNTGNLCPVGWHVPTYEESISLIDYLCGTEIAGGKLKEKGTTHWASPNTGATNETGFTALPGAGRNTDGVFGAASYGYYWWTSTEYGPLSARLDYVLYNDTNLNLGANENQFGAAVRCIRDY